jgi:hypothetical protein
MNGDTLLRDVLDINSSFVHRFEDSGLFTLGDLTRRSAELLASLPGIGDRALAQVRLALGRAGLALHGEQPLQIPRSEA